MASGISLHVGVNVVDPDHYNGWSGPLKACENDARDMFALATSQGFDASMLLTADATRDAVKAGIADAASRLGPGDMCLVTYAGHGGQLKDMDGDEEDMKDETWCLYDGQLLDDELNILWAEFQSGVRLLLLSDSCHSGSVSKGDISRPEPAMAAAIGTPRFMPRDAAVGAFRKNREFYANLQFSLPDPRPEIRATVRLLSGCQDDQLSGEGEKNGLFTQALKKIWADGAFSGDYRALHKALRAELPDDQQPNHLVLGQPNPAYDSQKPFSIES